MSGLWSEVRVSIYRRSVDPKEKKIRCVIFFFAVNATKGKRKFITKVMEIFLRCNGHICWDSVIIYHACDLRVTQVTTEFCFCQIRKEEKLITRVKKILYHFKGNKFSYGVTVIFVGTR